MTWWAAWLAGCEGREDLMHLTVIGDGETTSILAMSIRNAGADPEASRSPDPELDVCTFAREVDQEEPAEDEPLRGRNASAGQITLSLGGEAVELQPGAEGMADAVIEGWHAGALSISATGDAFPAVDMPELMQLPDSPASAVATDEQDGSLALQWTPSADGSPLHVFVLWDDGDLSCVLEDDGSYIIAADELAGTGERSLTLQRMASGWQADGNTVVQALVTISTSL